MFENEITKLIKDNLPAAAAQTLAKYIEDAEIAKKDTINAVSREDDLKEKLETSLRIVSKQKQILEDLITKDNLVTAREKAVGDCEVKLLLRDKDVACGTQKVELLQSMMTTIFRNTEVRKELHRERTLIVPQGDDLADTIQNVDETDITTETQE